MLRTLLFLTIFFIAYGCGKSKLQEALELAGNNHKELQLVLDYYSENKADSLKYRAAKYLVENMSGHYYFTQQLMVGHRSQDSLNWTDPQMLDLFSDAPDMKKYRLFIDSLDIKIIEGDSVKWDIENITAELLIENIEYAFKAWAFPWCRHLTFNEFCDYILPYRCKNEPLTSWRRSLYEQYAWIKDSLSPQATPLEACTYLQRVLTNKVYWSTRCSDFYSGFLPPALFQNIKVGGCENLACYSSLSMRAVGIPILYDEIVYWPRKELGHAHCWLVNNDSVRGYTFDVPSDSPPKPVVRGHGVTRVLRQTYEVHKNPVWEHWKAGKPVASRLLSKHYADVTEQYSVIDTFRYNLRGRCKPGELVWQCNITPNGYRPVCHAVVNKDYDVCFYKTTTKLYVLAKYLDNGTLIPVSEPFIRKNGETQFFKVESDSLKSYKVKKRLRTTGMFEKREKVIQIKYWDNGWVNSNAEALMTKGYTGKINEIELFMIEFKNVPKGTILYMEEARYWFTFDSNGKHVRI